MDSSARFATFTLWTEASQFCRLDGGDVYSRYLADVCSPTLFWNGVHIKGYSREDCRRRDGPREAHNCQTGDQDRPAGRGRDRPAGRGRDRPAGRGRDRPAGRGRDRPEDEEEKGQGVTQTRNKSGISRDMLWNAWKMLFIYQGKIMFTRLEYTGLSEDEKL